MWLGLFVTIDDPTVFADIEAAIGPSVRISSS
jgi:hypothetical protein